jgi:hypothetical protein
MVFRPNPAFDRFPAEAALVGRILSGFGELEITTCRNAAVATSLGNTAWKVLYGIGATSARIDTADRLMQSYFEQQGLGEPYKTAMRMLWHCVRIRNQYSPRLTERHNSHRNVTIAHGEATSRLRTARLNPTSSLRLVRASDLVVAQSSAQKINARAIARLPLLADMRPSSCLFRHADDRLIDLSGMGLQRGKGCAGTDLDRTLTRRDHRIGENAQELGGESANRPTKSADATCPPLRRRTVHRRI